MKRHLTVLLSVFVIVFSAISCSTINVSAEAGEKNKTSLIQEDSAKKGEGIFTVNLEAPKDKLQQKYLGVGANQVFTVADIDADLVLVEIFSMYCPHCQREAPEINKLYEKMTNSKRARGRVKMIGIGVGNSDYEVELFRKSYDIRFPLFPDAEFEAHKKIGSARTPTFIAVKKSGEKEVSVVHYHVGGVGDLDEFLDSLLDKSGL
jgi:peroxiredoxin